MLSHVPHIFQESIFKIWNHKKTYSEIRYIFGPNSVFQILFLLLESTQFRAQDDSKNGKCLKMDSPRSYPGPFYTNVPGETEDK
jgi:hypothetical protein